MVSANPERDGDVRFDCRPGVALFEEDQQALLHHGVVLIGEQGKGAVPEVVQDVVMRGALRQVAAFAGVPFVVIADGGQRTPKGLGMDDGQRNARSLPACPVSSACRGVLHT